MHCKRNSSHRNRAVRQLCCTNGYCAWKQRERGSGKHVRYCHRSVSCMQRRRFVHRDRPLGCRVEYPGCIHWQLSGRNGRRLDCHRNKRTRKRDGWKCTGAGRKHSRICNKHCTWRRRHCHCHNTRTSARVERSECGRGGASRGRLCTPNHDQRHKLFGSLDSSVKGYHVPCCSIYHPRGRRRCI
jgi:hypothetical protein